MIYMILDALHEFFPSEFARINWLIGIDATEEVLSSDFGEHLISRLKAEDTLACLVFEGGTPSNTKYPLVTARKGKANFIVQVEGRAAHAGNRHAQGANAIVQMAHTVQRIAGLTDYRKDLTYNVGTIHGGSVVNRVPHTATAEIEMRAFDPQVFSQGIDDMLALSTISDITSQDGFACKVTITLHDPTLPWPRNQKTDHLFDLWKDVGTSLGLQVIPEERGGLSDGNLLWDRYPTLDGLGPMGNNAHCSERTADGSKDQEYVLLPSFVPKAILNSLAIMEMIRISNL
jgi:glutamate carboxypeptidase